MKTQCDKCGAHFPEEFEKTLNCTFWEQRGLQTLSKEDKKLVWDWIFGFPFDSFAERTKIGIEFEFRGRPYYGNDFERSLPFYKDLPDKKRREFQKEYMGFISGLKPTERSKIFLTYFSCKSKKWKKFYEKP